MNIKLFLSAACLAQALLTVPAFGQFYCQPGYDAYPSPPVTVIAPATHHHIRNVSGGERSRFYTWVEFPNGHKTQIPVINGILPNVNIQCRNGRVTDLWMDYSKGSTWKSDMRGKTVKYNYDRPKPKQTPRTELAEPRPRSRPEPLRFEQPIRRTPEPVPVPKEQKRTTEPVKTPEAPEPAPVPKLFENGGTTKVPDIPQPKPVTTKLDAVLIDISDRLSNIQKQMEKINDLSDRMQRVEQKVDSIDALRKRMDEMDNRWKATSKPKDQFPSASIPSPPVPKTSTEATRDKATSPGDITPPTPKLDGSLRRPSDINTPEPDRTKQFPRYGV